MRLCHWMKREVSGLAFTTLEICKEEERQGHQVCIREPSGNVLYGVPFPNDDYDVDLIHSQFPITQYNSSKPKFLWCHGEPISSVGNGVSMKACLDLAQQCDALICMRKEEQDYWSLIKRTYYVGKGIDLDLFKPLPITDEPKLSGAPAVLYMEHWREYRNPLPLVVAMEKVVRQYPEARLHLYNVTSKKMYETFDKLIKECKLWRFVRSLQGPVPPQDVNKLLNRADIIVSCLDPLYARSIEALAAGKAFLCPGYDHPDYPFHCRLRPDEMAAEIIRIWEEGVGKFDFRAWAEKHHNIADVVKRTIGIYQSYLNMTRELEFQRA